MDYEITGKLIRNARKRKGLTQEQLAEMVNLSTMSIRRYERGERIVPDDKLQVIVEILGDSFYDSLSQYIDETPQRIAKTTEIWERQQEEEDAEFRRKVVKEAQEDIKSFVYSENGLQIILNYLELNEDGQYEAVKRVMELTEIPRYCQQTKAALQKDTSATHNSSVKFVGDHTVHLVKENGEVIHSFTPANKKPSDNQ